MTSRKLRMSLIRSYVYAAVRECNDGEPDEETVERFMAVLRNVHPFREEEFVAALNDLFFTGGSPN